MSDPLIIQVTNAGRAALVAAQTAGTNAVTIAQVGLSASATVVPSATTAALPGEHRRIATVRGAAVSADTIHMIVVDASAAAYDVRAFALYLADGTLFAIYGQAGVILSKAAPAIFLLAIDVKFEDIDAASITFGDANFLNPPATIDTAGVLEIATNAEADAGVDAQRAITPATMKYFYDQRTGSFVRKTGDTMTGLLTFSTGADEQIRLRAAAPFIAGFNPASTTRYGYVQFAPSSTVLSSDTGDLVLRAGGAVRLTLSAAGAGSFTGDVSVGGVTYFGGDPVFSARLSSGNPVLILDANDRYVFDRANDAHALVVGNVARLTVNGAGALVTGNLTVGTALYVGDTNTFFAPLSGNPALGMDAGDYFQFTRNTNTFGWYVGGALRMTLDGAGDIASVRNIAASGDITAPKLIADGPSNSLVLRDRGSAGSNVNGFEAFVSGGFFRIFSAAANAVRFVLDSAGNISGIGNVTTGGGVFASVVQVNGFGVWHAGNDGADSGLDADLLDGRQGAAYALRSQNVTFRDVYADRGDGTGVIYLNGPAGTRYLYFDGASYLMPGAPLIVNGGTVWTSANDGAGSGLDADLLDGFHAAAFARVVAESSSPAGGYRLWSDGHKEMWGTGFAAGNASTGFAFPVSFDSWAHAYVNGGTPSQNTQDQPPYVSSTGLSSFTVFNDQGGGSSITWRAHGY